MMRQLINYKGCLLIGVIVLFIIAVKIRHNIVANENHPYGLHIKDLPILQDETLIKNIINRARSKIKLATSNYSFSQSGVHGLEDLVMETGGRPQRTLVISTWRSGSSFLGDLLYHAVPSTYYTSEPLFMYNSKRVKTPDEGREALNMVKQMLECNFEGLEDYVRTRVKRNNRNDKQWQYCKVKNNADLCLNTEIVSILCQLYPFQNMKVVRLRLRLIEELLDDEELNMKVVLLIRDPRGVMQSRLRVDFCKLSPDCWQPSMLCADMVSDYEAAGRIMQLYPDRLLVVRFEELALQLNKTSNQILKFLKIPRTSSLDEFLQSHTSVDAGHAYSTTRVSHNVPYKWKSKLDFEYVSDLQVECTEAMRLWGYKMAHNETHMKSTDFHPVADYKISVI